MLKCEICGCTNFYKASGYFFCATCQTQSQDIGEEVELELPIENTTRLRKTKIRRMKNDKIDEELGWTSWELYNFVLIGLTNELIELGVSADVKVTVLQLWARYLGKLEVAFMSTKKKLLPKLARRYKKRDAEIIYGKVLSRKRARKQRNIGSSMTDSATSSIGLSKEITFRELNRNKKLMITADYDRFVQSQASNSEGDVLSAFSQSVYSLQSSAGQSSENKRIQFNSSAKKETKKIKNFARRISRCKRSKYKQGHVTTQYKTGPELITPTKLLAILYLALRIHNQDIHLSDMLRFGREGHLSYYKLDHLIPPEVTLTRNDMNFLSRAVDITHKGMRRVIGKMAKFLGVTKIICPNISSLVNRYCSELDLPKGISLYAERLIALSFPKMKFDKNSCIPNYEGRAMAFIIVVLKTLLCLDGITEYEISNVADKINSAINDQSIYDIKLFNFREWQEFIECRRAVLINTHCPTKLKYNPNLSDVNSLYIKFLEHIASKKDREEPEITMHKHLLPRELVHAMKQCIANINYIDLPLNEVNEFSPSLTSHQSYLQQLLEYSLYDLPSILRNSFSFTKIGYMTKPEFFCKLSPRYNVQLDLIDSNLHFIEKTVSLFEQTKMPSVKDLTGNITIQDFMEEDAKYIEREDFINYLCRKKPCQFKIDVKKRQYYDDIRNTIINTRASSPLTSPTEFVFDETLPNGKLSIPDRDDNEIKDDDACFKNYEEELLSSKRLLSKFCQKYAINLLNKEEEVILYEGFSRMKKRKRKLVRNSQGKFVKQDVSSSIESSNEVNYYMKKIEINSIEDYEIEPTLPDISDILNMNTNTSISDDFMESKIDYDDDLHHQFENRPEILETIINDPRCTSNTNLGDNIFRLYRPFKDYWMYHCNFSRVKPKNFKLFEKMLPRSFRWLLNECANIVEMSTEDLYEEICLVEAYHAYVSKRAKIYASTVTNAENHDNQMCINTILRKW